MDCLQIVQVTSVTDRVQSLQQSSRDELELFLQNGGWNLIHDWILQSYASNNSDLLLSILKFILELPSSSVLDMLQDGQCQIVKILELINLKETINEQNTSDNGGEDTAQLCAQILINWHLLLKQQKKAQVSTSEFEESGVKLCGITFHIFSEDGRQVILRPTVEKVWWLMTVDGTTTMVRMKEEYWRKLVGEEETSEESESAEETPPISPTLETSTETDEGVLLSSEDDVKDAAPNSFNIVPYSRLDPKEMVVSTTSESEEEPWLLSRKQCRLMTITPEPDADDEGIDKNEMTSDDSSSSTVMLQSRSRSPPPPVATASKRVRNQVKDLESNRSKKKGREERADLQAAINRVKQRMRQRDEESRKIKFSFSGDPMPSMFKRRSTNDGKLANPSSSPTSKKRVAHGSRVVKETEKKIKSAKGLQLTPSQSNRTALINANTIRPVNDPRRRYSKEMLNKQQLLTVVNREQRMNDHRSVPQIPYKACTFTCVSTERNSVTLPCPPPQQVLKPPEKGVLPELAPDESTWRDPRLRARYMRNKQTTLQNANKTLPDSFKQPTRPSSLSFSYNGTWPFSDAMPPLPKEPPPQTPTPPAPPPPESPPESAPSLSPKSPETLYDLPSPTTRTVSTFLHPSAFRQRFYRYNASQVLEYPTVPNNNMDSSCLEFTRWINQWITTYNNNNSAFLANRNSLPHYNPRCDL